MTNPKTKTMTKTMAKKTPIQYCMRIMDIMSLMQRYPETMKDIGSCHLMFDSIRVICDKACAEAIEANAKKEKDND